jgi:hypothetical protein
MVRLNEMLLLPDYFTPVCSTLMLLKYWAIPGILSAKTNVVKRILTMNCVDVTRCIFSIPKIIAFSMPSKHLVEIVSADSPIFPCHQNASL